MFTVTTVLPLSCPHFHGNYRSITAVPITVSLSNSHPSICVVLCKLFNLIMQHRYVLSGFRNSYIVPIPKIKDCRSKAITCFRGIAISPITSKVFKHCLLDRFQSLFTSSRVHYGFKTGVGCRNAIYNVRKTVDHYIMCNSTVNICAIDLSKAFDIMNHSVLYMKLMKRLIPNALLEVLENWMSSCLTCVKWSSSWSHFFSVILMSNRVRYFSHFCLLSMLMKWTIFVTPDWGPLLCFMLMTFC